MDVKEYIRRQVTLTRQLADGVLADLTDEQLNWTPPGTANPIGPTLAHLIGSEDRFIQGIIQGKPTVWETQNWGEKIGVGVLPSRGANWEPYQGVTLSLDVFRGYREAVRAATDAYLETVTEAELDRKVVFAGEERLVAEMLVLLSRHVSQHMGEISALKGVQGARGLPY